MIKTFVDWNPKTFNLNNKTSQNLIIKSANKQRYKIFNNS